MKPVLFHPEAEAEFDHSIGFYEERQTGLGTDFEFEVRQTLLHISNSPNRFPLHKENCRKYVLSRFPHIIYYLSMDNLIWIVAVAHCSRKPDYWKNRLDDKTAENRT